MSQQNSQDKGHILSGMRPTGPLHLGHLVGALGNWAKLQDEDGMTYAAHKIYGAPLAANIPLREDDAHPRGRHSEER